MSYSAKHWTLFLLWPERRCFTSKLSVGMVWGVCDLLWTGGPAGSDWVTHDPSVVHHQGGQGTISHRDNSSGPRRIESGDKSIFKDQTIDCIVLSVLSFIYCSQGFQNLSLNQIFFHFKTEILTIKISWFLMALKIISTREKAHTALTVAALTRDFSMAAGSIGRDDVGIPSDCQQSSLHYMSGVAIRVIFNWEYWEEPIMVRTQAEAVSREDRPDGESRRHQDQGCALDLAVRQGLKQTRHVKHFRCSTQLSQSSLRTGDVWKIPIWKPHGSNCSTEISC